VQARTMHRFPPMRLRNALCADSVRLARRLRRCPTMSRATMAPVRSATQAPRMAKQVNASRQNRASIAWPVVDLSAPAKRRRPQLLRSRRDAVAVFDPSPASNADDIAVTSWGSGPRVIRENFVLGEWYDHCGRPMKHTVAVPVKLLWVPGKNVCIVAAQCIPAGTVVIRELDAHEERCTVAEARKKLRHKSLEERQMLLGHSWG
jgi:hypothetical protein